MLVITNRKKQVALGGAATICLVLAIGLFSNMQVSQSQLVEENSTVTTAAVIDDEAAIIVPDSEVVQESEVDILLGQINATWAAVSGLITAAGGIIVYILNSIRARTGDRIISSDLNNRVVDVLGVVKQKSDELTDVFRQQLEDKAKINAYVDLIKSTNPELAKKIDEYLPQINQKIQNDIRPQTEEWRRQADGWYENLLRREPTRSKV